MITTLHIHLFGSFLVCRGEQPLTVQQWRSRQTRTILKVLAAHQGKVVPADQICHILWPDDPDNAATRRRLHVRISQLRQVIDTKAGHSHILTVDGGYALNCSPNCWLDVVAFETAVTQGRSLLETKVLEQALTILQQARQLYRGDFLAEDIYESWTFLERERLRETYLTVLTEMAEAYALQGRYRQAIRLCYEILSADSCREAVYVRLMLYHYYAGEQAQALRIFAQCQSLLNEDLGVEPLPATVSLAKKIQRGQLWSDADMACYPPPAYRGRLFAVPYSLGQPPLVGRVGEYAWLVAKWHNPSSHLLLIRGEAGVGKSYLIHHFLGYAASQGAFCRTTLAAEQVMPYSAFLALLPPLKDWPLESFSPMNMAVIRPLFPDLDDHNLPSLPQVSPNQATRRLEQVLIQVGRTLFAPESILFLDDAHHADTGSLAVLAELAETVTIIMAFRNGPDAVELPFPKQARVRRKLGQIAELTVRSINETAVSDLITQLGQTTLPDLAAKISQQTGGNPLFIVATLQQLFEQGTLYIDETDCWQMAQMADWTLPPTMKQTISKRWQKLTRLQQQILDTAAVAGSAFNFSLLQSVSQLEDEILLNGVDALLAGGWLVEPRQAGQAELHLTHAYLGELVYEMLPKIRRRHLHGKVAGAIIATAVHPETNAPVIAYHFYQAGDLAGAYPWLITAGETAQSRHALSEAVDFYQQALSIDENAPDIWDRVGHAAHQLARYEVSVTAYQQAALLWPGQNEVKAIQSQEAQATLAKTVILEAPPELVAQAHITLANAYRSSQLADAPTIESHLQQGLAAAKKAGAQQLLGESYFWLGVLAINRGDAIASLKYDEQGLFHFLQTDHAGWQAIAYNNMAYHALLAGQPRQGLVQAQAGLTLSRRVEARNSEGWLLSTLGEIQLHLGQLTAAAETLQSGLALVQEYGPPRLEPGFLADLAQIQMVRGNWETAVTMLKTALEQAETTAPQFVPRLQVLLAEAWYGLGDLAAATKEAQAAQMVAGNKNQGRVLGQAWRVLGKIWSQKGHDKQADEAYITSRKYLAQNQDVLEEARTLATWGTWLVRQGKTTEGTALLDESRQIFQHCEAVLDLQLLEGAKRQTPL